MVGIWHLSRTVKIGETATNISLNSEYGIACDYIPEDWKNIVAWKVWTMNDEASRIYGYTVEARYLELR